MVGEQVQTKKSYRYEFLFGFSIIVILCAFLFDTTEEIVEGYYRILTSPSNLLTDYMAVGGIGATFLNAGLLMLIAIFASWRKKQLLTGSIIAGFFTLFGFSFFGKNLFNTIPITVGVYLYSKIEDVDFSTLSVNSMFGTALGPAVSYICFGIGLPFYKGLLISYGVGILIGLLLPPLAKSFLRFHQGYTLYGMGFTCGVIGLFIQGVLSSFSLGVSNVSVLSPDDNMHIAIFMYYFFGLSFTAGYFINGKSFDNFRNLLSSSGRTPSDFGYIYGFGICLVNMSLLGALYTTLVLIMGQPLNGPILGGIFTIFGFGIFGKHVRNVMPILFGTLVAFALNIYEPKSVTALVTVLFATNLAPVAGEYGFLGGMIAGFAHVSIVSSVGVLHGGLNLYNNGFSGGFVAATLVPIYDAIRESRFFKVIKRKRGEDE